MCQNEAWAMEMIRKRTWNTKLLEKVLRNGSYWYYWPHKGWEDFRTHFFEQFCTFRSFSIISIAQASFWHILSHFRPKSVHFRPTDAFGCYISLNVSAAQYCYLMNIGRPKMDYFWSKWTQNTPKWSLGIGDDRNRTKLWNNLI